MYIRLKQDSVVHIYPCSIERSVSTILSPSSTVVTSPPRSLVLRPSPPSSCESRTLLTAVSIAWAGFSRPNEYRSSIAPLSIVPIGFAIPLPAMSGADPWIGSYKPSVGLKSLEGKDGAPAREAEGRRPKEPGMTLAWSERLYVVSYRVCPALKRHIHVSKQVSCQHNSVEFLRVLHDKHGSRVNVVVIKLELGVVFRQDL